MTIVVVTGTRKLAEHEHRLAIKDWFVSTIRDLNPDQVHHGGAAGPDTWAAHAFKYIDTIHRPTKSPDRTPAQALYDRNITMIEAARLESSWKHPVIMVACWDGQSTGTSHAIDYASAWKIPIIHVPVNIIVAAERCRNYTELYNEVRERYLG